MGSRPSPSRAFTLATVLALISLGPAAHAAEVSNRVIIEHGKLVIDHTQGIAEITRAQAKGGFRGIQGTEIGLGLFQNRMTTALEGTSGAGNRLTLITRIKTEPIIYLAKEFPADSCAYKVVLAHERRHYRYDRDVLRVLPDEIWRITQGVFATPMVTSQGEIERAKKLFFQQFTHTFEGLSFPLHTRIDNPASYAELANLCKGEIKTRLATKR